MIPRDLLLLFVLLFFAGEEPDEPPCSSFFFGIVILRSASIESATPGRVSLITFLEVEKGKIFLLIKEST